MSRIWKLRWNGQLSTYIHTTYENSSIMISKTESIKSLLTKKTLGPDNFNVEFHQIQGIIPTLRKLLRKRIGSTFILWG